VLKRTALFSALAQGEKEFEAIAVYAGTEQPGYPVAAVDRYFQIWRRMFCGS